jgi:hypothetical protein
MTTESVSIKPDTKVPCLSAFKKTSPKEPSSYSPVWAYTLTEFSPSPTVNLWVSPLRSTGSRTRSVSAKASS